MKKLEGKELYQRLQEARNFKKSNESLHQKIEIIGKKIELMEKRLEEKDTLIAFQQEIIEKQALRIEYLEKIIFGKSKKKGKGDDNKDGNGGMFSQKRKKRAKRRAETYQREIPKEEDITNTTKHELSRCPDCNCPLSKRRMVERYIEDIVLPEKQNKNNPLKTTERQIIETGWCKKCKAQKSAKSINGAKVFLGGNVKIMTVYLSIVMRLTYEQVKNMFRDIYHLKLSDGEIENILQTHGNKLIGEYDRIDALIRSMPAANYDETSWKILNGEEGNYGWIKTSPLTTETIFLLGKSRGKGNAEKLRGNSSQVGITDDYAGYNNVFKEQMLCWAHPLRKLRDLKESKVFQENCKKNCQNTFKKFDKLYAEIRKLKNRAIKDKGNYIKKFLKITEIKKNDPGKLKTYKRTLQKEHLKYFTFWDKEGVPMDNNQAERRLRHIVLKRKICFGSKSSKAAKYLEKLFSVVLTWWWKDPANFILNYRHLLS